MTAVEFVDTIKSVVLEASVRDAITVTAQPPGRRPSLEDVELSSWYNGLGESDRVKVKHMLELVAHMAIFGFLNVLDGTRQVEPLGPKGYFELRFIKDGNEDVLSGPQGELLHELL